MKIQHFIEHGVKDQTEFYKAAGSVLLWCLMETLIHAYHEQVLPLICVLHICSLIY